MPVLDATVGVILAMLAVAAIAGLRRDRVESAGIASSRTHPFLVGVYRGLAVVVLALVAVIVANMLWTGSGFVLVAIYLMAITALLGAWLVARIRAR